MTERHLPDGFADLEPYLPWALADEIDRRKQCACSPMSAIRAFYDAMLPRMQTILDHLNGYPLAELPDAERQLLLLALGFIEASVSVEMFDAPELRYGFPIERFRPDHDSIAKVAEFG
jgi:hypothetical protein